MDLFGKCDRLVAQMLAVVVKTASIQRGRGGRVSGRGGGGKLRIGINDPVALSEWPDSERPKVVSE